MKNTKSITLFLILFLSVALTLHDNIKKINFYRMRAI